jgi:5-methyltetrahydrofolate--homocysteine methyltransferase
MNKFLELLSRRRIVIADGATGTMLQKLGLSGGRCAEEWNLKRPDLVAQIPRAYVNAGSELVYTNTFGGNRIRLARAGLSEYIRDVNIAGAHIAKEAVGEEALIVGSMGPTGEFIEPLGTLSASEVRSVYAEQASALIEGGVDALVLETFASLEELVAAVEGVKSVANVPLFATMSFDMGVRTMMGVSPRDAVKVLSDLPVDAFGFNCGADIDSALQVAEEVASYAPDDAVLIAKPNAGKPHMVSGEIVWDVTPQRMAEVALHFAQLHFRIIGGCCGTTPEHIKAIAEALKPFRG